MALEQQKIAGAAQDNIGVMFGGVTQASKNVQAILSEFTQMSMESVDKAVDFVDRFSKAGSLGQILEIQNHYLKSSMDSFAQHSGKFAELMTSWSGEMGKTYRRVSDNAAEAGHATVKAAADQSHAIVSDTRAAGQQMGEAVSPPTH